MMKALIHIDNLNNWSSVLSNLNNIINYEIKKNLNIDLEVVINGSAVQSIVNYERNNYIYNNLKNGFESGFNILGCNNSIMKFGINPNNIFSFIKIIPSGIIEIIEKEQQGFAYIKP